MSERDAAAGARLDVSHGDAGPVVRLSGPLTLDTIGPLWRDVLKQVKGAGGARIDLTDVPRCDSSGAALVLDVRQRTEGEIVGAGTQVRSMLDILDRPCPNPPEAPPEDFKKGVVDTLGDFAWEVAQNARETIEYVGSVAAGLLGVLLRPHSIRWGDTIGYMVRVGADALGIIVVVNGLMGLILAFQSANMLERYGADAYVAMAVGIGITRELGPLMTAIVVAGRSGSAFAAEIGTMKVNEEVSALDAMGLERTRFLVLPKIVALFLMMPLLVIFADVAGIAGGVAVGITFIDLPLGVYLRNTIESVGVWDLGQGLIRAQCYSVVIAAVGCLRGLQTRQGAQGVGVSTTSAVVSGILLIIVTNAIIAIVFASLGI
jgi:phospholipid/cholesterol/gamma-HCH transport system permease protein